MTEEELIQIFKDAKEFTEKFGTEFAEKYGLDVNASRRRHFLNALVVGLATACKTKDVNLANKLYDLVP